MLVFIFVLLSLYASVIGRPLERDDFQTKCKGVEDYRYQLYLDPLGQFLLSWNIDYENEEIEFFLCVHLMTMAPSFLAIGFSERGTVSDADIIAIHWSDNDLLDSQRISLRDAYTDKNGTLFEDARQDIKIVKLPLVSLPSGQLYVTFRRSFDTCEVNDYAFDTGTTHVIYASSPHLMAVYGLETPFGVNIVNDGMPTARHGFRRVQMLKPHVQQPPLPDDAKSVKLTVENVTVPAAETTYWCHVLRLPEAMVKEKRHVVRFGGYVSTGHETLVHHMELFHCEVPPETVVPEFSGPCQSDKKPDVLKNCAKVIAAWAMGAPPFDYPKEAGKPIGAGKDEEPFSPWVMLEVHYNNPQHKSGMVDSSGLELIYTDTLRPYDAGTLEAGLIYSPRMAIPPAMNMFRLEGFCTSECTKISMPPDGIRVFASQLHTHLTGRRAYTKHVRNGVELAEINRDNHYSPSFQEIRMLPGETRILPGDELITVCEDATEDRTRVTVGGFAIAEEMCVNYMHYYPKVDLEVCKSTIEPKALQKYFTTIGLPASKTQLQAPNNVEDSYSSIKWTTEKSYQLQRLYDISPITQDCLRSNKSSFQGQWANKAQPVIRYPLARNERNCPYFY